MASGTKEYKIVINGLTESIEQVKALNSSLDALKAKIDSLKSQAINVTANSNSGGNKAPELDQENKLLKQIEATQKKISETRSDDYRELVRLKDELKQIKKQQDAAAASAKLMNNEYSRNTMAGMKEELKDIQRVMESLNVDSDEYKQLNQDAKKLQETLRDLEAARSSFGRNVGNYASAAEGFKGLTIQVGDVAREFNNATEALRQLKRERDTLGVNDSTSKEFKDLDTAVKQLQSSIKDLSMSSSFMDNMLDSMQSIVAIASTAEGIGAVFGKDNEKIEETIKKLVALQNVLQGLETIQKQMQTGEGLGKWLSAGNNAINKFSTNLFGAKKAVEGVAAAEKSATLASKLFGVALKGIGIGLIISLIASLVKNWDKINTAINKSIPSLEKFGGILGWLEGLFNSLINVMGSAVEVLYKLIQGDFSGAWEAIKNAWNSGFQEVADNKARADAAEAAEELKRQMDLLEAKYGEEVKYTKRYQQLLAERNKLLSQSYDESTKEGKNAAHEHKVQMEKEAKELKDHAKEMAKLQKEADQELTNLRISNMKEGLNKTLTQLEEERKARIAKARETGRNVREIEAEINKEYDRKELEAREEYAEKTVEIYRNMSEAIMKLEAEGRVKRLSMLETQSDVETWNDEEFFRRVNIPSSARTYGASVGYVSAEDIKNAQKFNELIDGLNQKIRYLHTLEENGQKGSEVWKDVADSIAKAKEELDDFITTTNGYSQDGDKIYTPFANIVYNADAYKRDIGEVFKARRDALKNGYETLIKEQTDAENEMFELRKEILKDQKRDELLTLDNNRKEILDNLKKWYDKEKEILDVALKDKEIKQADYEKKVTDLRKKAEAKRQTLSEEFAKQVNEAQTRYDGEEDKLDREHWENLRKNSQQYYDSALQEARDYQTAINNVMSVNPVYDYFGVFNWKANSDNIKEARTNIEQLINSIAVDRKKLNEDFKKGLIDPEYYENTNREFSRMVETCVSDMASLDNEAKQMFPSLMESLQVYLQAFSQTLSSVLDAVWAAQDAAYEKEMEDIDKDLEELEKKLDKQKELVQDYANNVDSIEDELSTARGDRRQELIDQLNAEKAAQREALREQQRIEKEQEKLKEKQEKLEEEQKKRQKARDITSALINSAMAVSYALANPWPFPAVALAAAAAIQGAAQVAAIKAQKYATGGLLKGRSHSQGGIPVGNTGIEVEGNEYIIRKKSAKDNLNLLDFINRSERKLNIDDFIDFYSSTKKSVNRISPQRRYATGGQLTLLPNNIDMPQRILDSIDAYANRPVVVSVVDIIDRADDLRGVQVQAGLSPRTL